MIPKIIHQIWSGTKEPLPAFFHNLGETWKEFHPKWQYEFWDNNRMISFVREFYPQYEDLYNRYPYDIPRWDVIRYLILYKTGGMYVDFDYECLENIEPLLEGKTCAFAMEPEMHAKVFNKAIAFNNALMASVPAHPFIKEIIEKVFSNETFQYNTTNKMICVLNTTGPWMLERLYSEFNDKDSIYLIPAKFVSPFDADETDILTKGSQSKSLEEELERKLQEAYAIHYFFGTWK